MQPFIRLSLHRAALRWVTGLMLCALVLHGATGVVLQVLGPSHRHADVSRIAPQSAGTDGQLAPHWHEVQAWLQAFRPQTAASHLFVHGAHEHRHGLFERHHHDPNDPSVIALDGAGAADTAAGEAAAGAGSGSVTMPLALAANLQLPLPDDPGQHWPRAARATWRNADQRLPYKPPRG